MSARPAFRLLKKQKKMFSKKANSCYPLAYLTLSITTILLFSCSNDSDDGITGEGIFQTASEDAVIEGELFLPEGDGPFPSMIIIAGSGNEPRQEFETLAPILNENGYGLYIFDKRGVGGSEGSYPFETPNTQEEFLTARAQDVIGIIDLLLSHDQIDNARIGIFGSSQGAWVNSIVHALSDDLAYIVMASGGVASTGLESFYCSLTDNPEVTIAEAIDSLDSYSGVMGFDPLSTIQTMSLPVLWLYGEEDRSHPARYDVAILEELNKPNFTVEVFAETSHELLLLDSGLPPDNFYDILGSWLTSNNP